jgi:fructoselysine-6-P-deglycase FrlB-like protein
MQTISESFRTELERLEKTYLWATTEAPVEELATFCKQALRTSLLAIGSGGSLTVAALAALMHQHDGKVSKHMTPLELFSAGACLPESSVLFPSAGGKNIDVMNACRFAAARSPKLIHTMCGCFESPLTQMATQYSEGSALEFEIPTGKDGFLATVSLVAFCTILIRAYNQALGSPWPLPPAQQLFEKPYDAWQDAAKPLFAKDTWMLLHGSWGLPAVLDAESKLAETTLMSTQRYDYRNLAHGYFHWLAQHEQSTGIVAFITPEEKELAELTLSQLPETIPQLRLETKVSGPVGTLDLMLQVIYLADSLGVAKSWDAARMTVPPFAKQLQQLSYSIP